MLKNYHPRSAAIYLLAWFILALFINDLKTLIGLLGEKVDTEQKTTPAIEELAKSLFGDES